MARSATSSVKMSGVLVTGMPRSIGAAIGLCRDAPDAAAQLGGERVGRRRMQMTRHREAARQLGIGGVGERADAQHVDVHWLLNLGCIKPRRPVSGSCAGTRWGR